MIPAATAPNYTIVGVNLGDDAIYRIAITIDGAPLDGSFLDRARLAVSSSPPIVFRDGNFAAGDWTVSPFISADQPAPA